MVLTYRRTKFGPRTQHETTQFFSNFISTLLQNITNKNWNGILLRLFCFLLIIEWTTLSTSNCIFPPYQGKFTIFDKGNFLYQTPGTKNLLRFKGVILPHPPLSRSKRQHTQRLFNKAWLPLLRKCMCNGRICIKNRKFSNFSITPVMHAYTQQNKYVARGLKGGNCK